MIAIFDVDGTFLRNDSLVLAARKSRSKKEFLISLLLFLPSFIFWKLGLISSKKAKIFGGI